MPRIGDHRLVEQVNRPVVSPIGEISVFSLSDRGDNRAPERRGGVPILDKAVEGIAQHAQHLRRYGRHFPQFALDPVVAWSLVGLQSLRGHLDVGD